MSTVPQRALIVIDVQNEYVNGRLPIEFPPLQDSLANIGAAMDAAHRAGIPVCVVQNEAPETSPLFAKGSAGWALHPAVAHRPRDHLVVKTLPDAFAKTDLGEWLEHQGIDTITVVGYMTHNCDAATIFHAMHRGLTVEFLADASGAVSYSNEAGHARAADIHRAFTVVLHSRFAAVAPTSTWITSVETGDRLPKSSIIASHAAAQAAH
jgi:nicotinamidase-related amidase